MYENKAKDAELEKVRFFNFAFRLMSLSRCADGLTLFK